jgi:hypothetical protein
MRRSSAPPRARCGSVVACLKGASCANLIRHDRACPADRVDLGAISTPKSNMIGCRMVPLGLPRPGTVLLFDDSGALDGASDQLVAATSCAMPRERSLRNHCSAGRLNGGDAGGRLRLSRTAAQPGGSARSNSTSLVPSRSPRSLRAAWPRSASLLARVVEVEVWVERAGWSVSPSVSYSPKRLMRSLMYGERGPQLLE